MSCPLCYGKQTLSLSKENGTLKYNCFRASCGIHGVINGIRTIDDIRSIISKDIQPDIPAFEIPWYFTSIANHENAFNYLKRYHCLEAYYDRACNVLFDPRLNRVVYTIRRRLDGVCVDAVGRSLGHKITPKWLRYNNSQYPFIVGTYDTAVIVEDCTSACAVYAAGYSGVAFLGTNLVGSYISELKQFPECIIALDPDAASKSLKIARKIEAYTNVKVRFIKNDLKYYNKDEIREQLK